MTLTSRRYSKASDLDTYVESNLMQDMTDDVLSYNSEGGCSDDASNVI